MSLTSWLKQHPILAYIVLAMAWSWSIWSLLFLIIEPGGLVHNPPLLAYLPVVVGGFGPTLSGLLLTRWIDGREGMRALWSRLRHARVGRWWLALLIIPSLTALTPLLRWLSGYPVDGRAMLALIGPGLGLGIVAGLMEEFGWRGFLLPHLLKRHRPFAATLLTGLIWGGLWHGYADYFGLGDKGPAFWPLMLLLGPALLTAWSLILTWVYEGTQRSLLLSIAMHASISSSALIFGQPYAALGEEMAWTAISVGVAWIGALVIWFGARRQATRSEL
jgi:membrane protease YdiL (CAAX protease family)